MKKALILILFMVMATGLCACGNVPLKEKEGKNLYTTEAEGMEEKEPAASALVYGSGDYTRINPAMDEHGEINLLIFDGLTAHDGMNQVVPGLARSWVRQGQKSMWKGRRK